MWGRKARRIKQLEQTLIIVQKRAGIDLDNAQAYYVQTRERFEKSIEQLNYDNSALKACTIKAEADLEAFRLQRLAKAANLPEAKTTYYPDELAAMDLKKAQEHQDDNSLRSSTGTSSDLHSPLEERVQPSLDDNPLPKPER